MDADYMCQAIGHLSTGEEARCVRARDHGGYHVSKDAVLYWKPEEAEAMQITEQQHENAIEHLDRLISSAYEAKEAFLLKRYEDAAGYLDEAYGAVKKAGALINEMWE